MTAEGMKDDRLKKLRRAKFRFKTYYTWELELDMLGEHSTGQLSVERVNIYKNLC